MEKELEDKLKNTFLSIVDKYYMEIMSQEAIDEMTNELDNSIKNISTESGFSVNDLKFPIEFNFSNVGTWKMDEDKFLRFIPVREVSSIGISGRSK